MLRLLSAAAAAAALTVPAAASAASTTTNCAGLQAAINAAATDDTVTLSDPGGLCREAITIPSGAAGLTIAGAAGATNGLDGSTLAAGTTGIATSGVDGLTLSNLTVQGFTGRGAGIELQETTGHPSTRPVLLENDAFLDDSVADNNDYGGGGGALILLQSGDEDVSSPVIVRGSTFDHDTATSAYSAYGGGLEVSLYAGVTEPCSSSATVTLDANTFTHDAVTGTRQGLGGGAYLEYDCFQDTTDTTPRPGKTVTGNRFAANTATGAQGNANNETGGGGGLFVAGYGSVPSPLTQSANLFTGNAARQGAATDSHTAGGGEEVTGHAVTSTGDTFAGNAVDPPVDADSDAYGAGLAVFNGGCVDAAFTTADVRDAVVVGNTIAAPASTSLHGGEGAGIYAGCNDRASGEHLTLTNSTVTANSALGTDAVSGVDGETDDTLVAHNSIVYGNTGQNVGGFGTHDGDNVTVAHSDLCAIGSSTAPFAGTANLCTDPKLTGGAPSAYDVHETAASPTVDAGDNTLVPTDLTTDAFGNARIAASTIGGPATVDIGAGELPTPAPVVSPAPPSSAAVLPPVPVPVPVVVPAPTAKLGRVKATSTGASVTVSCAGTAAQSCSGAITLTSVETTRGSKLLAVAAKATKKKRKTVTVGGGHYAIAGGTAKTITVKLNRTGTKLLKRFHTLPVKATVLQGATKIATSTLKLKAPAKKQHQHR